MIKVVPYILMCGTERFKTFLSQPFNTNMLYQLDNVQSEVLFDGWRGKNMGSWLKFTNDDDIVLEVYPTQYTVTFPKNTGKYLMGTPVTINDFINDMYKCNVQLYWSEWIHENFEPKDYLHKDEIREYFVNLLSRMGKSHELL